MKKALIFTLLILPLLPVAAHAKLGRLITVQTPYVDTDHFLRISVISFRPLGVEFAHSFGGIVDISADTILPLWFFAGYNFGAKVSLTIPNTPMTIGASCNVLVFRGEDAVMDIVHQYTNLPVLINDATINFSSTKLDIGIGFDLKLLRLYAVADLMLYGNDNGSSSYVHPTIGADIAFGSIMTVFAEIGYYFTTEGNPIETLENAGVPTAVLNSDFTAGAGVELDMKPLSIRIGVQYPGMDLTYPDSYGAIQEFHMPVVPYIDLGLQF